MRTHVVEGGAGLHVRDFGPLDGRPILLVHGWSQHHISWSKQFDSRSHLCGFDPNRTFSGFGSLRGHRQGW
jgi:pimeloyl-ACP methyl ester carboxylesterase